MYWWCLTALHALFIHFIFFFLLLSQDNFNCACICDFSKLCVFLVVCGHCISSLLPLRSPSGLTVSLSVCISKGEKKNTVSLIFLTEFLGSLFMRMKQLPASVPALSDQRQYQHTLKFLKEKVFIASKPCWECGHPDTWLAARHLATCHGARGWKIVGSIWDTEIHYNLLVSSSSSFLNNGQLQDSGQSFLDNSKILVLC